MSFRSFVLGESPSRETGKISESEANRKENEKTVFGEGGRSEWRENLKRTVEEGGRASWNEFCTRSGGLLPVSEFASVQRTVLEERGSGSYEAGKANLLEMAKRVLKRETRFSVPSNVSGLTALWSFFQVGSPEDPNPEQAFAQFDGNAYKALLRIQEQMNRIDEARTSEDLALFEKAELLQMAQHLFGKESIGLAREYYWVVRENKKN